MSITSFETITSDHLNTVSGGDKPPEPTAPSAPGGAAPRPDSGVFGDFFSRTKQLIGDIRERVRALIPGADSVPPLPKW